MLLLSRKPGESIKIGDQIEVKLLGPRGTGSRMVIAIEAPRAMAVHRKEVYERIQQEKAVSET